MPHRSVRPALLALVASLLLGACTPAPGAPAAGPPGGAPAAGGGCPATVVVPPAPAPPTVPAAPAAETVGRLVPEAVPTAGLVCRYVPSAPDAGRPAGGGRTARLAGSVDLTAGLARLPADLRLPRTFLGVPPPCRDAPGAAPRTGWLMRLSYPDGPVWVGSAQGCSRTSDGPFDSDVGTGDLLAASFAARAWTVPPWPDAAQRCVPGRTGRAGQESELLPRGAVRLVLCRVAGDGVTRVRATAAQLAVVQEVLASPVAQPSTGQVRGGAGLVELAAVYASGPAVLVRYVPGGTPDIDNGSLSASVEPAGLPRLTAVLDAAFAGR